MYADAGYANDNERRSRSGILFLLSNSYLETTSTKQKLMATSTTEAEIVALTSAGQKTKFFRMFLDELGFIQGTATVIHQDNAAVLRIVRSDKVRQRSPYSHD